MSLDHEAIRKAYPSAVTIDDGTGAFDANGVSISLDQAKIDSARITLDAENAAIKYKTIEQLMVLQLMPLLVTS